MALLLALAGCSDQPANPITPVPAAIRAFVDAERLPLLRNITVDVAIPERDLVLFSAEYGEAQDCPAGCFYSLGFGIALGSAVGWTGFADGSDRPGTPTLYDIQSGDVALFDAGVWARIESEQALQFWRIWLPFLAVDPDTSGEALQRIALRLPTTNLPALAMHLLANPAIAMHPEVLQLLACLPDSYQNQRQQARDLLGAQFPGCDPP